MQIKVHALQFCNYERLENDLCMELQEDVTLEDAYFISMTRCLNYLFSYP
ncbi:hypothetical protein NSA47_13645 [Irregularibacter muris]|uniref:Uncharacterized protein n=1 Tax=Irregularibacter muris TaxID=1796619 RepID=A0AAE3HJS4_9FIRM|nr:hypothetical protein [Irregularibacter muris]MCR1900008.1 hypothetical protein [Irregularibacter muris]